jgi:hypothetical protein
MVEQMVGQISKYGPMLIDALAVIGCVFSKGTQTMENMREKRINNHEMVTIACVHNTRHLLICLPTARYHDQFRLHHCLALNGPIWTQILAC